MLRKREYVPGRSNGWISTEYIPSPETKSSFVPSSFSDILVLVNDEASWLKSEDEAFRSSQLSSGIVTTVNLSIHCH
jgi:hypothetical protein